MDELKQALADAEQAHIAAAEACRLAEETYQQANIALANAQGMAELARRNLIAAVVGESL